MMTEREKRELQDDLRYYREKTVTLEEAESRRREQDYNDERRRRREREREREERLHEAWAWPEAFRKRRNLVHRQLEIVQQEAEQKMLNTELAIISLAETEWAKGMKLAEEVLRHRVALIITTDFPEPRVTNLAVHLRADTPSEWLSEQG